MNIQTLPPKMAQRFADKAKRGEFDIHHGSECYSFFSGNNKISLVSINPPLGHVEKLTTGQMEKEKLDATLKKDGELK